MWIEIFRTGSFQDSKGRPFNCDSETMRAIERTYNEATARGYQAPLVKGHPSTDAPAYGWVERLARRGNKLLAKIKDISDEISREVAEGRYRYVSISLTPELLLRHVGLLGAAAPAVDGLQQVQFNEYEQECYHFSNDAYFDFEHTQTDETQRITAQNEELKKTIRDLQIKLKTYESREFVEKFLERNKLIVKNEQIKEKLVELLVKSDSSIFSEDEIRQFNLGEQFLGILEQIKPSAYFTNLNLPTNVELLNKFDGKNVSSERMELHRRAIELTMQNPEINYQQALSIIQGGENVQSKL